MPRRSSLMWGAEQLGRLLPFHFGTKGGIKAAGRRPSPGRPDGTAIWLMQARLSRFYGFGSHKVPGNSRCIAAPRPDDGRLALNGSSLPSLVSATQLQSNPVRLISVPTKVAGAP